MDTVQHLKALRDTQQQIVDAADAAALAAHKKMVELSAALAASASPIQPGDYVQDASEHYWKVVSIDGFLSELDPIEESHFVYHGCPVHKDGSIGSEVFAVFRHPVRKMDPRDLPFLVHG